MPNNIVSESAEYENFVGERVEVDTEAPASLAEFIGMMIILRLRLSLCTSEIKKTTKSLLN